MSEKIPPNPIELFKSWITEAKRSEINDANAMSLASIDENGEPSVRIVLLKGLDQRGFVFYTNFTSRKGKALAANPVAESCFHWKTLERQVRVLGPVEKVSDEEADAYFATRPRTSQIGAWASQQTQPMEDFEQLDYRVGLAEEKFKDEEHIPRPPHWGGYRIKPKRIEFWHAGDNRLHKRYVYKRDLNDDGTASDWRAQWLFP